MCWRVPYRLPCRWHEQHIIVMDEVVIVSTQDRRARGYRRLTWHPFPSPSSARSAIRCEQHQGARHHRRPTAGNLRGLDACVALHVHQRGACEGEQLDEGGQSGECREAKSILQTLDADNLIPDVSARGREEADLGARRDCCSVVVAVQHSNQKPILLDTLTASALRERT